MYTRPSTSTSSNDCKIPTTIQAASLNDAANQATGITPGYLESIKKRYDFISRGFFEDVADGTSQVAKDLKSGNFVLCKPENNPDEKFKTDLYITGLKDCPGACVIVKERINSEIELTEECLNMAENTPLIRYLDYAEHQLVIKHYTDELNAEKTSWVKPKVYQALLKDDK